MDVYLTGIESQIPHPLMIFSAYFRYSLWPSCDPDTKSRKKKFQELGWRKWWDSNPRPPAWQSVI